MGSKKRAVIIALGWAAAVCLPTLAHASGQVPIFPVTESFKLYQDCVAALETAYAEDRKQVAPLTVDANGSRRQVELTTKGVERISSRSARYDATIWYHNGGLRADLSEQQIETTHSYEHRIRQCDGRTMKTSGERGYTMSTFDPVETADSPKR